MVQHISDDEAWEAVQNRSRAHDGIFFTGVLTTGIYCRPSCAARHPLRENVRFFASVEQAESAGLRPCKRCLPKDITRDMKVVSKIIEMIQSEDHVPTLAELASRTGYSSSHVQKLFKRRTGMSPAQYGRALRLERAYDALGGADRVTDAIYDAGYSGPSRFYAENEKRLGMQASAWKDGGNGVSINWTVVDTYLGKMMVAATAKGVCRLAFDEGEEELMQRFPNAQLKRGGAEFAELFDRVVAAVECPGQAQDIPLDVKGTAFQEAIWAELQKIPPGETRSYADLAAAVGRPKAYRAAGSANGANNVAVLIPCHRVVASDGGLGGYAYGLEIKQKLLDAERKDIC